MNNLPPTTAAGPPQPALESFQEAAQQGPWLHVSQDGAQWQVKATGITPSQRSVAWVEPQSEADTTSAFVAALGQSFSRGIQSAVARELGLEPAPGRPCRRAPCSRRWTWHRPAARHCRAWIS
ncbi:hypothetical protein [Melaminivora jejuensis]|uniref:hypothetical protein n=1 Tax=Melaminivora jejuensis TaxID=1267217 RepID=UPI001AE0A9D2|nr:hypothetical protein [Melaminivora jejuensis]